MAALMARSRSSAVSVLEDTSMERLVASQLSRVLVLAPPWALLILTLIVAEILHLAWGHSTAAIGGLSAGGAGISVLAWHVTRQRGTLGRWFAGATAAVVTAWTASAMATGVTAHWTSMALVIGGGCLCVAWNVRVVVRQHSWDQADNLSKIFADAADKAGLERSRLQVRSREARRVEAVIVLPPGERVADDVVKRAKYLESGMRLPPGSLTVAPDLDRADHALVTISDPRVMRKPLPWEGPPRSGTSVALPLEPGLWQDGQRVRYVITGHHVQIMAMTGAGKSVGAGWSLLSDLITRHDVAVLAADITKGEQTLGPLRPALHDFATTSNEAIALLRRVQAVIRPRTDYLAARGLQRWQEGCGLTYLLVWLEEAPDVLDCLGDKGMDRWLSALKAARSAGITFVLSLQRSDWTQMPTLARGQLAKLCMGVENAQDAAFGLSDAQQDRNCRPELWNNSQPGMAYLHAPGIPDDRIAMPWRTWYFGDSDKLISEHAARWPASGRPLDVITVAALGGSVPADAPPWDDDDDDDIVARFAPVDEPADAEMPPDDIAVPAGAFGAWQFARPRVQGKADPAEARGLLAALIGSWRQEGVTSFRITGLADFREQVGLSRQWLYKALAELAEDGGIEKGSEAAQWLILERDTRAGAGVDSPVSAS